MIRHVFFILLLVLIVFIPSSLLFAIPQPVVTVGPLPADAQIGESFTFTIRFENATLDIGYGPFIDLWLPRNGADGAAGASTPDGITFVSATMLGNPLQSTTLIFPGSGCVDHPFLQDGALNPVPVCSTAGDEFTSIRLPFSAVTLAHPPIEIEITAQISPLADPGAPLSVRARGGFQYGADPLNNPCCDAPVLSAPVPASITPQLLLGSKNIDGTEEEIPAGANFDRVWTITVDIPTGQTITDLDITDYLPTGIVYLGLNATIPAGTITDEPAIGQPVNAADNTVVVNFATVIGSSAPDDITIEVGFHPANSLNAISGDDLSITNRFSALGDWAPQDGRDAAGANNASINGLCPTVCPGGNSPVVMSLAGQKVSVVLIDTGAPGPTPGDTLEYTLSFQISDFFAFEDILLTDILSDGQFFDATFAPRLTLTQHGAASTGAMNAANFTESQFFTGGIPGPAGVIPPAVVGDTLLEFRVADEMALRTGSGNILGGCVPVGGTGGPAPDCAVFNGGPTTGLLTYRAVIRDAFVNNAPSGDVSLDHGDQLSNAMTVRGQILNAGSLSPVGHLAEDDDSAKTLNISRGEPIKSLFAINGVPCGACAGLEVHAGDTVTYRLRHELPSSDFEDFSLSDFLPLPIYDVNELSLAFDRTLDATIPPAGQAKYFFNGVGLPLHTVMGSPAAIPSMSAAPNENIVVFSWGDFDDPLNRPSVIDLLFTVTVTDQPFADGIVLANFVNANQAATNVTAQQPAAAVQLKHTTPSIIMRKGAVSSTGAGAQFIPPATGPVPFNPPGANPPFTGTINSNGLAAAPIRSDIDGIQPGDVVRFAIVVENVGSSVNGAFDIRVNDILPPNFAIPAGGLNLDVRLGNGIGVAYTPLGPSGTDSDLFSTGIELTDPGLNTGVCGPYHPTNGTNIVVISYDLQLASLPAGPLTNIARMGNYAAREAGFNHTGVLGFVSTAKIIFPLVDAAAAQTTADSINGGLGTSDPLIAKRVDNPFGLPGDFVTWTVEAFNNQGRTLSSITMTDTMPTEVDVLAVTSTRGTVSVSGRTYTISIPTLNPGERVVVTIRTQVRKDLIPPYLIVNTASLAENGVFLGEARAQVLSVNRLPNTGESPFKWLRLLVVVSTAILAWYALTFSLKRQKS